MNKINLPSIVLGVFASIGLILAAIAIIGSYVFISTNTFFNFSAIVLVVTVASLLTGGWLAGYRARAGGLLNGGITGLLFAILMLMAQANLFPELFSIEDIVIQGIVLPMLSAVGGVVGVNTPHLGRRRWSRRYRAYV